ncbi:MAG TPA: ABC transporter ATP-binding protein [Alphaproteobacteria bacterium]|nr:ABC transporter ATP-binding protein [Alphaproteobacteria bacterium]
MTANHNRACFSLELRDVTHHYGRHLAINQIEIFLKKQNILCLLGPSGCGKSTILRLIAGLEKLQQGEMYIEGNLVANSHISIKAESRGVGLVFQDYVLFPHLTVAQNIAFGLSKLAQNMRQERVEYFLDIFHLHDCGHLYPHTLSGGQQQRVALARALAPQPKLLLLDEAFSSLDVRLRSYVREQTLEVIRKLQTTVIMVSHDPVEAMEMADEIAIMRAGRIIQIDSPYQIYHNPKSEFIAEFFGETSSVITVCHNGMAESYWGHIPVPNEFHHVNQVKLMIRAEAFYQTDDANLGVRARIHDVRDLGRMVKVHLSIDELPEPYFFYAVLAEPVYQPKDAYIRIAVDPKRVVVLPIG